jgi:hypothetical protein
MDISPCSHLRVKIRGAFPRGEITLAVHGLVNSRDQRTSSPYTTGQRYLGDICTDIFGEVSGSLGYLWGYPYFRISFGDIFAVDIFEISRPGDLGHLCHTPTHDCFSYFSLYFQIAIDFYIFWGRFGAITVLLNPRCHSDACLDEATLDSCPSALSQRRSLALLVHPISIDTTFTFFPISFRIHQENRPLQ